MERIKLGELVTDITGFTGYATARCEYVHGGQKVYVERASDDGQYLRGEWIEEARLKPANKRPAAEAVPMPQKATP